MNKIFYFLIIVAAVSCSGNPDKILDVSVQKFLSGEKDAIHDIENSLIRSVSSGESDFSESEISASAIFIRTNKKVKFLYPEKFSINLKDAANYENFQTGVNGTHVYFILDGIVHLYKRNGDFVKDIAAPDKDGALKIDAAVFYKDSLIFYSGENLFVYSYTENKMETLVSGKLNANIKSPKRIILNISGDKLSAAAGIGGEYNLNIIDIPGRNIVVKNLSVSSAKFYASESFIRYIDGGSGQWKLMEMSFADKKSRELAEFRDVVDVELLEMCALIEGKKSISIFDYIKTTEIIHFDFELAGSSAGMVILAYRDKIYPVSAWKLLEKIRYLKQQAPDLFVKK